MWSVASISGMQFASRPDSWMLLTRSISRLSSMSAVTYVPPNYEAYSINRQSHLKGFQMSLLIDYKQIHHCPHSQSFSMINLPVSSMPLMLLISKPGDQLPDINYSSAVPPSHGRVISNLLSPPVLTEAEFYVRVTCSKAAKYLWCIFDELDSPKKDRMLLFINNEAPLQWLTKTGPLHMPLDRIHSQGIPGLRRGRASSWKHGIQNGIATKSMALSCYQLDIKDTKRYIQPNRTISSTYKQ